jgi:hypothetical protein
MPARHRASLSARNSLPFVQSTMQTQGNRSTSNHAIRERLLAFVGRRKLLTTCLVVLLATVAATMAWSSSASARGTIAAQRDTRHGHYVILLYGLPSRGRPDYFGLLKERYGIESKAVAGCIVSRELRRYVDSYNAVVRAAVNRKYGRNVFEETNLELQAWEKENGVPDR